MAKGSQLSQLKTALNKAGLSQQPQHGKKRKRSVLDDKEKERRASKLREIQQKMNPFDVKVTKLKHDVGGRKIAGLMGRPAQSKQAGIEQRKKTLLKEYEEKDRSGGIVDRRFGENDPSMAPEERMLERFTRERQRTSKGDVFNLEDEEELTHYGQSLSKLDDFDNIGLDFGDEEEEGGAMYRRTVEKNHFGGFEDEEEGDDSDGEEPERKKSKAEVMAEVIAKSKEHKFMRQTQQEADENLRHELDQELDSIRSLLYAPGPSDNTKSRSHGKNLVDGSTDVIQTTAFDQEYDQFVRELASDKRAQPKDRTKTEEELALEEKEALEKAEKRRIRRMNGEDEESGSEDEKGRQRGGRRKQGGDDLEDDFVEDDSWGELGTGLGSNNAALSSSGESEGTSEDDEEDSEDGGDGTGEEADNDIESSEDEAGGEVGDSEDLVQAAAKLKVKTRRQESHELPYTFPCPTNHDEFLEIVESVPDSDIPTVVKRIRALHHPSLATENKSKLQALTGVLIDYVLYITTPPSPRFSLLSALISHIFALSKAYPTQAAEHFVAKLVLMQKNLKRGLARGAHEGDSKTWPGLPELCLLRVIGIIWSTSDMNHHVVSPARLLMGAYLGLCRVRSLRDLASGLFLSTIFFQYEDFSKRLVPEVINFLANCVLHLAPTSFKDRRSIPGTFPVAGSHSPQHLGLTLDVKKAKTLVPKQPDLTQLLTNETVDEQEKLNIFSAALGLLLKGGEMYKGLEGFLELYDPVCSILKAVDSNDLPGALKAKIVSITDSFDRLLKFSKQSRQPLRLQAHKPIPLTTYIPKFEHSSSNYLRNRDPDHERNEAAKLRTQYKQERKGAIRELRKDGRFLAAVQQKKQLEKDREYNTKLKRVYGSIETERAEQKALEKEKQKEKRRSGRK